MSSITIQPSMHRKDIILGKLRKYFSQFGNANIQPKQIRMEKKIIGGNLNFTFEMGERNNMGPLETSLAQSDVFVPIKMAWGVSKVVYPTSNFSYEANSLFYTYPDKKVFAYAPTPPALAEWQCLNALWNGQFGWKANTIEIIDEMLSIMFLKAAQIQDYANAQAFPSYQNDPQFVDLFVNPLIRGSQKNVISFTPAPGADTSAAGGNPDPEKAEKNIAVLILDGFVIRNADQSISVVDESIARDFNNYTPQ